MTISVSTYFKTATVSTRLLSFGTSENLSNFNYVKFKDSNLSNTASIAKHMIDSCQICLSSKEHGIRELKLTNQEMMTWEDYWVDRSTGSLIDPKVERIDLRKNQLSSVNFNISRPELKELILDDNGNMSSLFLLDAPNLSRLSMSGCSNLSVVNLGNNKSLEFLSAKNCNLNGVAQERLLRDFRPIKTSDGGDSFFFRKEYTTLLDLRGNQIDWSNRRVASKIRLLLCNNWLVLWDNPPPATIVPVQMYAFFTSNLEDHLVRSYYG
jgi:hypothetical protein